MPSIALISYVVLALAGSMTSAKPLAARAACNPVFAHSGVSIASGGLELGYNGSTAGAAIISQTFSPSAEFIGEVYPTTNGGYYLKDANQENQAAGLFPTWVNGSLELETQSSTLDGKQDWAFICASCADASTVGAGGAIGSSCNVVNGWTGQCVQIGSAAGDVATIVNCDDLGSGPQYFDVIMS